MTGGAAAGCMAMMVTITTSGGIGGFGLARSVRVAVEELPPAMRAETCEMLAPGYLRGIARAVRPGAADFVVYHIVVQEAQGAAEPFDLPEPVLPAQMLDLIDALLAWSR